MYRGLPTECPPGEAAASACVGFAVERLGGSPGGSDRRGLPLAAPDPCDRAVAGYLWSGGVWYYGLCTAAGGEPATTTYAIQFDPQYAHAERVLAGCEPVGMGPTDDGVVLVGRCGGRTDAVELAEAARRRRDLAGVRAEVACADGHPQLALAGQGGTLSRNLSAPASRLEAWLPEHLAPAGSRAIWTGDALVVAYPVAREVSFRRYQCVGGELTRTDAP